MYVPLCEAWPLPPSGCPNLTGSPEVTGAAVMAASEYLWALSGFQFGSCEILLRPCRQSCTPGTGPFAAYWWDGAEWPTWPMGSAAWPMWLDAVCGRCVGSCDCRSADTVQLPTLVQSVNEVVIDGVVLPASAYTLYDDGQLLVRTDGERWPICQDWSVPVSGVGAWSVELVAGRPVPVLGQLALGQLAAEFARWCDTGECRHPAYTTQKTRQGVSQTFPSAADLRQAGLTGWAAVDTFLRAVNPHQLSGSPGIWNPDDIAAAARRPGGVT